DNIQILVYTKIVRAHRRQPPADPSGPHRGGSRTFRAGDRVRQRDYGPGDVCDVSSRYISATVHEGGVTRKLVASSGHRQPTLVSRPAAGRTTARARRPRGVAAGS